MNEPELAEAISRLRGEWAERSDGEVSVTTTTWKEFTAANTPVADVIIFPSRYLGELCVRGWLRPVRSSVLESQELNAADIFPLVRQRVTSFDNQLMALPLGIDAAAFMPNIIKQPAMSLLAEAAPAALSENREGVLFDTESMKSRIGESVFVEALSRLAARKDAATLPSHDIQPIPVLGFDDRLAAVTSRSRNAASAFQLLTWLAQPDTSSQLARAATGAMPVRRSLASSSAWYDSTLTGGDRAELGKALSAALSGQQALVIPRIPGIDDYMAALDESVKSTVVDEVSPQSALDTAAKRWEEITEAHDRDTQRKSYLKHLGISVP